MIERVIENWLGSVNERQYQIPFCQLLASEGERIIYVSSHGQLELGIDVLSIDSVGTPKGYQLKQGDVAMADWRRCQDEVVQLVESHPSNPSIPLDAPPHQSFFVTNGTIKDPVLNAINQRNKAWEKRNYGPLTPIAKTELLARFKEAHGKYLPESPKHLREFLELYTANGESPIDKERFAGFIENVLPLGAPEVANRDVQRAVASATLLTSYLIQNRESARNHWALFEAWVITGAAILALATKSASPPAYWEYSFTICEEQAEKALADLCEECSKNTANFTQGNPFSDGHVYGPRMAILCGLIAANSLSHLLKGSPDPYANFANAFLRAHWNKGKAWGESAIPYFVLTALALEAGGNQPLAEAIIRNAIQMICTLNKPKGIGFPNPYWNAEESIRLALGMEPYRYEVFAGHSYTLQSLIHILARRWLRQTLKGIWYQISEIDFATLSIQEPEDWLRWRSTNCVLDTRKAPRPQSWKTLLEEAEKTDNSTFPRDLRMRPTFGMFFCLVYPHRFQPDLVRIIDKQLRSR